MRSAPALLALALVAAGCGGRGGGLSRAAHAAGRGRATFTVRWPAAAGRLIPNAAASLLFTATKGGQAVGTLLVKRPTATGTLTGLPYGQIDVKIEAKPNADGTGVAQALGGGSMTVTEDVPGRLDVALDSRAATLSLASSARALRVGQTTDVIASARDTDGNVVLLAVGAAQETLAWTDSDSTVATIIGTGPIVAVKGLAQGSTTLGATLKVKDDGTTIAATPLPLTVDVAVAEDDRLAVGGYPKTGGDAGNSGRGGGNRSTAGTLGWNVPLGASVTTTVVGPDGAVYAGAGGTVYALDPLNGAVRWQKTLTGTVRGLLVTQGGQLLVGATKLVSLDATGGAQNWAFPDDFGATNVSSYAADEVAYAPNVLSDGTVVLATNKKVLALNGPGHTVRWTQVFASTGAPAVATDDTVVVWNTGAVRGFLGATGAQAFSKTSTASVSTAAVGTYPYVLSYAFAAPPCVTGTDVTYSEVVFSGTRTGSYSGTRPFSYIVYSYTGTWTSTLYTVTTGGSTSTAAIGTSSVKGATALMAYTNPTRIARAVDGHYVLSSASSVFTFGAGAWSAAAVGNGGVSLGPDGTAYVATTDATGIAAALNAASGASLWSTLLPARGTGVTPAAAPDGTLYVGTTDGRLTQIR